MGVDFSSSIGYGIAPENDELPDFFSDEYGIEPDLIDDWLKSRDFKYIKHATCGDSMCGETWELFYLDGTYVKSGTMDFKEFHIKFNTPEVSREARGEFLGFQALTGIREELSWHMFHNIS